MFGVVGALELSSMNFLLFLFCTFSPNFFFPTASYASDLNNRYDVRIIFHCWFGRKLESNGEYMNNFLRKGSLLPCDALPCEI